MGQLKTSLSHLEYENEQLKKTTAKLQRENRSMEDRLVQEQMENGDLTARLDDARNLLRDRGIDADVRLGSHRGGETLGGSTSEGDSRRANGLAGRVAVAAEKNAVCPDLRRQRFGRSDRRRGTRRMTRAERPPASEDKTLGATDRRRPRSPLVSTRRHRAGCRSRTARTIRSFRSAEAAVCPLLLCAGRWGIGR